MRVLRRRLGTVLIVLGVLVMAYAGLVVFWRDPVTDLYTSYQQHEMQGALQHEDQQYAVLATDLVRSSPTQPAATLPGVAQAQRSALRAIGIERRLAFQFTHAYQSQVGTPIGQLRIGRIGLSTIFVQGTDYWAALTRGPGHYDNTSFPGLGRTVAIAGHRTTWSAPFRHIDDIRNGDVISLTMPYGVFRYRVTHHLVVASNDWSIIHNVGYEELVLSACHPLYSASHRWIVFARLVSITLPGATQAILIPTTV